MNIPTLLSINWNPDPELFNLFGSIPIRYYGLLWVVGIALAYAIVHRSTMTGKSTKRRSNRCSFIASSAS